MIQPRKASQKNTLNSIRLCLLDWDPMNLFLQGSASLEEYDEYIPSLIKLVQKNQTAEELIVALQKLAKTEMGQSKCDSILTAKCADKLLKITF